MTVGRGAVLVVEDDREIRQTLQDVLESEGYRVITAANGKEGLECLERTTRPDLMVVDLMMPVMGGEQFLAAVRQHEKYSSIPAIVLSAWPLELGALDGRAEAIVKKPVALDRLLEAVEFYRTRQSE